MSGTLLQNGKRVHLTVYPDGSSPVGTCTAGLATTHHSFLSSFSAVSRPRIARNGAFFHIFRDLQDFHAFAPPRTQNFNKIDKIHNFCQNQLKILRIFRNFSNVGEISERSQRNLLKFCVQSGAKVWKSCRSRKTWKNAPFLAIVAVDTAENEPSKDL